MADQHSKPDDALWAKREEILRIRAELDAMLRDVDRKLGHRTNGNAAAEPVDRAEDVFGLVMSSAPKLRGRPVRDLMLDSLEDLASPAYSRELALYCEARYGRKVPAERFGTLASDEIAAYRKAPGRRPVYLCFALTADRHEPIKRLLARSDWPLECRVVAPTTGRVQHLKITAALCELALGAEEAAADPEMMRIIAADHARDLPVIKVQRGKFDLGLWRDTAHDLLSQLEPRDELARRESALRLADRPEFFQLFGLPDVIDGGEDPRSLWRKVE
jgi:hypothetical protein